MDVISKCLDDLLGLGYTQTDLAALLDVSQSAVSAMWLGKRPDPGFHVGASIMALHEKEFPEKKRARQLPRRRPAKRGA